LCEWRNRDFEYSQSPVKVSADRIGGGGERPSACDPTAAEVGRWLVKEIHAKTVLNLRTAANNLWHIYWAENWTALQSRL
jgi:hypothetical protein